MVYKNETEFEKRIRSLIAKNISKRYPEIYVLDSKKAVDIVICKEAPSPKLFFIEVKYHKKGVRLGFGHAKGNGFQPEILSRHPRYFESHLKWALASETHPKKIWFLPSNTIRQYLAGGKIGPKFNNIQKRIYDEQPFLTEVEFIAELRRWLGVKNS